MSMRDDTTERLRSLIADQLSIAADEINETITLEQLGADSLDRVEIIMKLEEAFDVEVNDDEAEKLTQVGDLVNYVVSLREKSIS